MTKHTFMVIASIVLMAAGGWAQDGDGTFSPGLELGETIPDFVVVDQTGKDRDFADLRGSRGALFVFYRSAKW